MKTIDRSMDHSNSGRRVSSLVSFLDANPVDALRNRLDHISRAIATTRPQAAQLIHLNRVLDTVEALLYLPRASQSFEDGIIAAGQGQDFESAVGNVQATDEYAAISSLPESLNEDAPTDAETSTASLPNSPNLIQHGDLREYQTSVAVEEMAAQLDHLLTEMKKRAEESSHLGDLVTVWREETVRELQTLKAECAEAQERSLAELRYLRHKVDYLEERTTNASNKSATSSPRRFREPVVAELVETLGIPPRFSSLASSQQSESDSPSAIRRQIERTRQETEMVNGSINERKNLVEDRVKALNLG